MYRYGIEATQNGVTFYDTIYADNGKEAVEFGWLIYPNAEFIELF